jgi:hypothetical protein
MFLISPHILHLVLIFILHLSLSPLHRYHHCRNRKLRHLSQSLHAIIMNKH